MQVMGIGRQVTPPHLMGSTGQGIRQIRFLKGEHLVVGKMFLQLLPRSSTTAQNIRCGMVELMALGSEQGTPHPRMARVGQNIRGIQFSMWEPPGYGTIITSSRLQLSTMALDTRCGITGMMVQPIESVMPHPPMASHGQNTGEIRCSTSGCQVLGMINMSAARK